MLYDDGWHPAPNPLSSPWQTFENPSCDSGGLDPTFGLTPPHPPWWQPTPSGEVQFRFICTSPKYLHPFQFHRSGWPSDAPRTSHPLKVDQAVVKQIRCTLCHHKSILNQISASTDVVIKFCPIQIPLARWEQ